MTSKLTITDERLAELVAFKPLPGTDINSATRDEWMAMAAELHERRKADNEPVAWLWSRDGGDERDVSLTPPDDDDDAADAIECGWTATPLYRHAQQPVVDADDNFYSWFGREWQENYQHNQYTTAAKKMLGVMAESAWIAATERQRQKQSVSVPDVKIYEDVPYEVGRFKTHRDCYCDGWNACRAAMLQAGNSPVIPDGYMMVPMRLTAENGAKGVLSGEFSETKFVNCPECFGDDECETCDGSGRIEITVPVTWTTIKEIWAKGVEHFAAAPQEVPDGK